MGLQTTIKEDLKAALKEGNSEKVGVHRLLSAALHNREIEKRAKGSSETLTEEEVFGFVGPTGYNFALSVQMLFGLVIGGMQSLAGAIVGGLFLQFFPDVTAGLGKGLSALLYAMLLIAAIVAMPTGVVGTLRRLAARFRPQ